MLFAVQLPSVPYSRTPWISGFVAQFTTADVRVRSVTYGALATTGLNPAYGVTKIGPVPLPDPPKATTLADVLTSSDRAAQAPHALSPPLASHVLTAIVFSLRVGVGRPTASLHRVPRRMEMGSLPTAMGGRAVLSIA